MLALREEEKRGENRGGAGEVVKSRQKDAARGEMGQGTRVEGWDKTSSTCCPVLPAPGSHRMTRAEGIRAWEVNHGSPRFRLVLLPTTGYPGKSLSQRKC